MSNTPDILTEGLMSVEDVMSFLQISRSTIWRMMDAGSLPYTNIGRIRRIPRRSVLDLASRNLVK